MCQLAQFPAALRLAVKHLAAGGPRVREEVLVDADQHSILLSVYKLDARLLVRLLALGRGGGALGVGYFLALPRHDALDAAQAR